MLHIEKLSKHFGEVKAVDRVSLRIPPGQMVGIIGQELMTSIRQFIYTDVSAIVLMLILTVILIDISCEKIRHRFIGRGTLI